MKKLLLPVLLVAVSLFISCSKQETEAEKNAEVERQVQARLAAEHQAEEQHKLAQQQADLDARERALAEKEKAVTPTPFAELPSTPVQRTTQATRESFDETQGSSYATFYRKLEPYGDWIETGDYGYVWQPREAERSERWRPYTNGHWVYTDAGWTWVSDERFGWATYHYGRWARLRGIGWVWVPGDEWAPAWVSWRKSDEYVGWAPLPPEAQFDRGIGIRNWADNYYDIGPDQYAFVPSNEFGSSSVERTVVPIQRNVTIINQTTNVTNITYNNSTVVDQGPSYDDLRSRSQYSIERLRLERNSDANFDNDRAVVKGEVLAVPAPIFQPTTIAIRPPSIKQTITQTIVERGWSEITDQPAAQKARAKMKAEATPPSNPPPKKFVKPAPARACPSPTSTAIPTTTVVPTTTAAPSATAAAQTRTVSPTPNDALQKQQRRKAAEQQRQQMSAAGANKAKARGGTKSARADKTGRETAENRGTTKAPGTAQNGSATKGRGASQTEIRHEWNNSSVSFCSIAEHYPRFPVASPRLALASSADHHSLGEKPPRRLRRLPENRAKNRSLQPRPRRAQPKPQRRRPQLPRPRRVKVLKKEKTRGTKNITTIKASRARLHPAKRRLPKHSSKLRVVERLLCLRAVSVLSGETPRIGERIDCLDRFVAPDGFDARKA